jgi:beta-mannosidase
VELWVTNSSHRPVDLDLVVESGCFDDDSLDRAEVRVHAAAFSSAVVWQRAGKPPSDEYVWVSDRQGTIPANRRFFAPLRHLPLQAGSVTAEVRPTGDASLVVDLTAQSYCYLTRLCSSLPGARFSSNYLDLRPGQTWSIDVTGLAPHAELTLATYRQPAQVLRPRLSA